jgi:hypothetical protein
MKTHLDSTNVRTQSTNNKVEEIYEKVLSDIQTSHQISKMACEGWY